MPYALAIRMAPTARCISPLSARTLSGEFKFAVHRAWRTCRTGAAVCGNAQHSACGCAGASAAAHCCLQCRAQRSTLAVIGTSPRHRPRVARTRPPRTGASNPRKPRSGAKPERLLRQHAPDGMALPQTQTGLRRQFGREQGFTFENLGDEPLLSDFRTGNPGSGSRYRVGIRGAQPGDNRCTCGNSLTNEPGTCKHIEFVPARLERKRGTRRVLNPGAAFAHTGLWLSGGARRSLRVRSGTAMPSTRADRTRQRKRARQPVFAIAGTRPPEQARRCDRGFAREAMTAKVDQEANQAAAMIPTAIRSDILDRLRKAEAQHDVRVSLSESRHREETATMPRAGS